MYASDRPHRAHLISGRADGTVAGKHHAHAEAASIVACAGFDGRPVQPCDAGHH